MDLLHLVVCKRRTKDCEYTVGSKNLFFLLTENKLSFVILKNVKTTTG